MMQAGGGAGPVAALELRPNQGRQLHKASRVDVPRSASHPLLRVLDSSIVKQRGCQHQHRINQTERAFLGPLKPTKLLHA